LGLLGFLRFHDAVEAVVGGFHDVFAPQVERLIGTDGDDFFRGGHIGEPRGGHDGFEAHAAFWIGGGFFQEGGMVGDAVGVVA
jgi:hypothetical protein